jgi:hypothetical protein
MPVHDWTQVEAGIFHAFHVAWIGEIQKRLNAGMLPKGYYALAEQHAGLRTYSHCMQGRPPLTPGRRRPIPAEAPPLRMRRRKYAITKPSN